MGTTCTLPKRRAVSIPSKVIMVQPKKRLSRQSSNSQKNPANELQALPDIVKIETNLHDPNKNSNEINNDEDIRTNHTAVPNVMKYDIKDLGIGEYYLEKELNELNLRNSNNTIKTNRKVLKKNVKWDRAIVQMRIQLGNSIIDDSLYNFIDISLKEYAATKPQKYAKMLKQGLPMRYRWSVWKNSIDMNKFYVKNLYEKLRGLTSAWEKTIKKDIHRSFPEEPYFASSRFEQIGQEHLFNVLKCLSLYFPNIGYTQSMNFIVGFMLLVSGGNEVEVFWMFVTLARDPRFLLMGLFEKELPLLDFYIYAFYEVLQKEMPAVHDHIKQQQLPDQLWLLKWFMTLFLYSLPTKYVLRVWDYILEGGLVNMIKVALGIINFIEKDLLTLDIIGMDALFKFLNSEKKLPIRSISAIHPSLQDHNISHANPPTATQPGNNNGLNAQNGQANANNTSMHKETQGHGASINNEISVIDFKFKDFDIDHIMNYAMKVEISNARMGEIMKSYTQKLEKELPQPYSKLLGNWEEYIMDVEKLEELQWDIEHHMLKAGLIEANEGQIVITNLLEEAEEDESSAFLRDLDV